MTTPAEIDAMLRSARHAEQYQPTADEAEAAATADVGDDEGELIATGMDAFAWAADVLIRDAAAAGTGSRADEAMARITGEPNEQHAGDVIAAMRADGIDVDEVAGSLAAAMAEQDADPDAA